jgi:hypothetical protein
MRAVAPSTKDNGLNKRTRKPWHKPEVSDYGHVSKLTAGTTGSHTDKGHMSNSHGGG